MRKAIIIIGGGPLGVNTVTWAKELGFFTIVTDRNRKAPGLKLADLPVPLAGDDIQGQLISALGCAEKYDVAGIYCANDFGLLTVSVVSTALGLPTNSLDATVRALDKRLMKERWLTSGVLTPQSIFVTSDGETKTALGKVGLPAIIKPVDNSGSEGVEAILKPEDQVGAYLRAASFSSNRQGALIEQLVQGRAIDANGLFIDGKFYGCGVLEKHFTPFPHRLPICGYDPAPLEREKWDEVYSTLERACRALGIIHGPVKGDFVMTKEGIEVLEVTPRFHGDVTTSNTLPYASGINPVKAYFKFLSSGHLELELLKPQNKPLACWRVICLPPGKIRKISGIRKAMEVNGITKIFLRIREGSTIGGYRNTGEIPGYICAFGQNTLDLESVFRQAFHAMRFEMERSSNGDALESHEELILEIERNGWNPEGFGALLQGNGRRGTPRHGTKTKPRGDRKTPIKSRRV